MDGSNAEQVQEFIAHSWYEYGDGDEAGKHPWSGETTLKYAGPKPPYDHLDVDKKYSWLKTPRWKGHPMEVGSVHRVRGTSFLPEPGVPMANNQGDCMINTLISRIYVWQLPVRFYHWINAACVVILSATGYFIGWPLALQTGGEASFSYWFGTIRFIHFLTAFVFFFNFIYRIYWGFVGNTYSDWRNFILIKGSKWKEIKDVLAADIFQARVKPLESAGHNALAGLTYFISFLAFLFQCITGFGMYAAMSNAWLPRFFVWIVPLMGGDFAVRQWHHLMMWFFVVFSMIHVYLVFCHDYVEGRGVTSLTVGGWKFIERERRS